MDEDNKVTEAGFLELSDANESDSALWEKKIHNELDRDLEFIELKVISLIGEVFENLIKTENRTRKLIEKSILKILFLYMVPANLIKINAIYHRKAVEK